jgi:hypothetical protein
MQRETHDQPLTDEELEIILLLIAHWDKQAR